MWAAAALEGADPEAPVAAATAKAFASEPAARASNGDGAHRNSPVPLTEIPHPDEPSRGPA